MDARVWLEISKTDESTIAAEDKAKIEGAATEIMGEDAKVTYFDADLFKKVGAGSKSKVSEPGVGIKITIIIPEELLNHDKTMAREYKIIRLHEGAVEVISGEFNAETREFTFETDKFSTYAIAYGDTPVNEKAPVVESPKTGEQNMATYAFALVLMSGLGILFYERKRNLVK